MSDNGRTYFTTRPRLATLLMEKGFNGRKVPNIYNPQYGAWEFDPAPGLMSVVNAYFEEVRR